MKIPPLIKMPEILESQSSLDPLNNPAVWLKSDAFIAPLSAEQLQSVQTEIDSIIGTTRDNKSIVKVVWNGDRDYWKEKYTDWTSLGKPIGGLMKRPWVLYKSIFNSRDIFIRDSFPPRYLLLTRLEPEQYAKNWAQQSKIWDPVRKCHIQILPEEPPKERWLWYETIAVHEHGCCQKAAEHDVDCYGFYAHPRQCLEGLRETRKGMDESGIPDNDPFAMPDAEGMRYRSNVTNNYEEQARDIVRGKPNIVMAY